MPIQFEAASHVVKACAESETDAGVLLGIGISAETELSLLNSLLAHNPQDEVSRME